MKSRFDELSLVNKRLLLEDLGIQLMSIEFYDHRIHLYEFDAMFVEEYIRIEDQSVEAIRIASDGDLDKYLSRIALPYLPRERRDLKSTGL